LSHSHISNFKNYKAGKLVDDNLQSILNYHQKHMDEKVQETLELNSISFEYPSHQKFGKIVKNSSIKKLDKQDFDSNHKEKVIGNYFLINVNVRCTLKDLISNYVLRYPILIHLSLIPVRYI
jgi:hypothetical protein